MYDTDRRSSAFVFIIIYFCLNGFEAISERYFMEDECGRLIDMEAEHLESIRVELTKFQMYSDKMDCVFRVKTPDGKRLEVKIWKSNIESSPNCTKDFLQIYDGPELTNDILPSLENRVCSSTPLQSSYESSDRYISIRFKSDEAYASDGFRLHLTAFRTDPNERCLSSEFQCKSNKRCISQQLVCDHFKDCTDASDECELSIPAIIGIAVGGVVALLLIIGIFVCVCWARSRREKTGSTKHLNQHDASDSAVSPGRDPEVTDVHYNRPSSVYQSVYAVPSDLTAYTIEGPYYIYNKPEATNMRHVWITSPPEVNYVSAYDQN